MALLTDPRDLLLDDDNDLVITSDLQWSRGIPAVMQSCRIALQMFQGEWFLDLDAGIPYWDQILGQKPATAIAAASAAFRDTLVNIESVVEVLRCDVTYSGATRILTVIWRVRTEFGDTPTDTLALSVGGA
jgi:hypothetical protein